MRNAQRLLSLTLAAGLLLTACSAATPKPPSPTPALAPTITPTPVLPPVELGGIKTYLAGKTGELRAATTELKATGQAYYQLAAQSNFDYAVLWQNHAGEATKLILVARAAWVKASALYAQTEGIVAGTPNLASFDLILNGAPSSAGDSAPYDLTLGDGRVLQRPGHLFGVTESALWGTWPDFAAPVAADWNRDGTVGFGEGLPDAYVLQAAAATLDQYAGDLAAAAAGWTPTPSDALTALNTMLPTMSEYFSSWKNSRLVAGDATTQRDFGVISRLSDLQAILGSLQVVYENASPLVQRVNANQDSDVRKGLAELKAFVAEVYQQELGGKVFTAEEADLLGGEAQNRATVITGLVTQAAAQLNIEIGR